MHNDVHLEIGGRIKHLRKEVFGWSLEELSRRARVSKSYIEKIEAGRRDVPLGPVSDIAAALGIDLASLLAPAPEGWGRAALEAAVRWKKAGVPRGALRAWLARAPWREHRGRNRGNPHKR